MAHSRTDKVGSNIFLYIMQWTLLLTGFGEEASAKAKTAVEGQRGCPIGAVYREYLNISKKCPDSSSLFCLKCRKYCSAGCRVLKKNLRKANIFQEYLHDVLFPLFWERRNTLGTHRLIKIKIILLKHVGGTLSKKLGV